MKQIILISLSLIFSLLISAQPINDFLDFDTTIATLVTLNHQNRNYNRHTTATNNNFIRHQNDERRSNQISNFVFQSELRKIKNQSNSYIKKLCSKRLLDSYQLNARQITMLCNSLRGYAKLEVAQYAYTRCQDLNNYDLVLNSLSYDMRDEFNDYINYINEQYRNSDEDVSQGPVRRRPALALRRQAIHRGRLREGHHPYPSPVPVIVGGEVHAARLERGSAVSAGRREE